MGQSAYEVATLTLLPHSENVFLLFKDGWHQSEVAADNATVGWQWSKLGLLGALVNLLLPSFAIAFAGPVLIARMAPGWKTRLERPTAILQMIAIVCGGSRRGSS